MAGSTFFVSEDAVRNLKHAAARGLGGVSSSHLSEGVAAALGFKTHAALRAALDGHPTIEVLKPSNPRFAQRLRELGYAASDDLEVLPNLEQSYTPFKRFPLHRRTARWMAWRNLMTAAVNAGLQQRLFGLSPGENWWPGGAPDSQDCEGFEYAFKVDADLPAVASVNAISGDELSISVIVNRRDQDCVPEHFCGLEDGDATGQCWVERRLGAWLQDGADAFHCRRSLRPRLSAMSIEPLGYSDQGIFIL